MFLHFCVTYHWFSAIFAHSLCTVPVKQNRLWNSPWCCNSGWLLIVVRLLVKASDPRRAMPKNDIASVAARVSRVIRVWCPHGDIKNNIFREVRIYYNWFASVSSDPFDTPEGGIKNNVLVMFPSIPIDLQPSLAIRLIPPAGVQWGGRFWCPFFYVLLARPPEKTSESASDAPSGIPMT